MGRTTPNIMTLHRYVPPLFQIASSKNPNFRRRLCSELWYHIFAAPSCVSKMKVFLSYICKYCIYMHIFSDLKWIFFFFFGYINLDFECFVVQHSKSDHWLPEEAWDRRWPETVWLHFWFYALFFFFLECSDVWLLLRVICVCIWWNELVCI